MLLEASLVPSIACRVSPEREVRFLTGSNCLYSGFQRVLASLDRVFSLSEDTSRAQLELKIIRCTVAQRIDQNLAKS